ncbi:MAG: hypothetical protein N3A01_04680 [Bacteroidales bacterium]|nr:hypothetical protein [Bacteroidales bacterium]
MKLLVKVLSVGIVLFSCAVNTDEAIKYNNDLVKKQINLVKLLDKLDECFKDTSCNVKLMYDSIFRLTHIYLDSLKKIEDFNGDSTLRIQFKKLLESYKHVLESDYKSLITLYYSIDSIEYNEDTIKMLEKKAKELYDSLNDKIRNANNQFIEHQKKFAEKYGFNLY